MQLAAVLWGALLTLLLSRSPGKKMHGQQRREPGLDLHVSGSEQEVDGGLFFLHHCYLALEFSFRLFFSASHKRIQTTAKFPCNREGAM